MYLFLKKIVRKILPQKIIFKIEPGLRKAFSFFYRGNKYHCTICDGSFNRFISVGNGELLCPRCGSLPRDRRLFDILEKENLLQGKVLDFSPSRTLYRKLKKKQGIEYFSSDFSNEFLADHQFDITDIKQQNNYFDLIICYHVLEHVNDDRKALAELLRVLKPGGNVFIQTPFRDGEIFENPSITSEKDRMKNFGQKDHLRIYSVEGLSERLTQAGFKVQVLQFKEQLSNRYCFSENETILHCKK